MSTLYNVEPQPTAKVLLKTTAGDIELELFAKQTPLASRNFLQHCLDGYYDNTLFFRLVPGFIIQGGDPTGLGTGGESALEGGAPFADEFHSRLRFNRRGLLGMANSGEKDDNTSQFFLTLDKTPELQGKNTMFGRVEGDTVYNLMKMGEAELTEEGGERPLYPSRVLSAEILVNPFGDMVKRTRVEVRTKDEDKKAKKKRKTGKNMLSFGGDEGEDAPVIKKAKVNPNFKAAEPVKDVSEHKIKPAARVEAQRNIRRRSTSSASSGSERHNIAPVKAPEPPKKRSPSPSPSPSPERSKPLSALERTNAEIAALKAAMKRGTGAASKQQNEKPKSALEAMMPATATRGRKRGRAGADDSKSLDMFNAFRARLGGTATSEPEDKAISGSKDDKAADEQNEKSADAMEEEALCDLHFIANCQSCKAWDGEGKAKGEEDAEDDPNWMAHKLSFAKDTLGKDLEWKRKMEEYEEIDTRTVGRREEEWSRRKGDGKERDRRKDRDRQHERRDRDRHHERRDRVVEDRRRR